MQKESNSGTVQGPRPGGAAPGVKVHTPTAVMLLRRLPCSQAGVPHHQEIGAGCRCWLCRAGEGWCRLPLCTVRQNTAH